ncbi:hypothetical protein CLAIMM_15226, partial [Cladophialophora immunda]
NVEDERPSLNGYHFAFSVAVADGQLVDRSPTTTQTNGLRLHRDNLPPEPKHWRDLKRHPFRQQFEAAAQEEFDQLKRRGTFKEVDSNETIKRPLPLLWVFKYKFDTDGFLDKFKARIYVRGDLQTTERVNYAATLTIKVFRALMALAAAFDLEILQLDAVNAFLNSAIDEDVTVEWPQGFHQTDKILLLLKALYGLKQAPLLWHDYLVRVLKELGLQQLPGINCVLTNDEMILFFYVDDIIILYRTEVAKDVERLVNRLKERLDLRVIDKANWFLGIRIIRDR